MIYGINERPKSLVKFVELALQQLLAVFVATTLIPVLCGTPINSAMLGGAIGTLLYQLITGFKSPVFISSCGATVSAVVGALSLNAAHNNYLMVFCGGVIIFIVYAIFALIVKKLGTGAINKIFPPTIVGAVTMVIGLNLATFINGYTQINGAHSDKAIVVAVITMIVVALVSHYGKGFIKNIPFLIAIVVGYLASLAFGLVSFDTFNNMQWCPELSFLQWNLDDWSWANLGATTLYFVPVAVCALLEHYSDHKTLSNIVGVDLTETPGLHKTLLGDGVASAVGTALCGLPNTSYGESIATIGFSKVASVSVTTLAAVMLGLLSFIAPVGAFIQTIPAAAFAGCAMILYGFISASGLKTLINNKVNLENTKNLVVVSVILTVGVSGIYLFDAAFAGVSLAMVLGVIVNLLLKEKTNG